MAAVGGPVPPAVHEPATATRWLGKPGPAYPGFPAQGASALTGGRASGSPPREVGLPGRGVSESPGRGAPKEWRGPKGSRGGEGTPRRDPGGPAGCSRPQGRARSGLLDQPQPSPGWEMGRGARGSPRDGHRRNRGEAPRPPAGGVGGGGQRGPRALRPWNLRASGMPLSRRAHPYSPPPTGGGFRRYGGPPSRSALLCRGDAPPTKGRVPAKSAGAPAPAEPRVRVPRPVGDGAG
jgi:hypothetical protein